LDRVRGSAEATACRRKEKERQAEEKVRKEKELAERKAKEEEEKKKREEEEKERLKQEAELVFESPVPGLEKDQDWTGNHRTA